MENTIKIINFEMKVKSVLAISLTVVIVFIWILSYIDEAVLINASISITSSFIGICGGYYVSKKSYKNIEIKKALTLKKHMVTLLKNEISQNIIIFNKDYDEEIVKIGFLDLKSKKEFKVDVWHKLEFKIFAEGIEILDVNRFTELCELYRRLEILNLQKELNANIVETSKNNILNYIHNNLVKVEEYLRAE